MKIVFTLKWMKNDCASRKCEAHRFIPTSKVKKVRDSWIEKPQVIDRLTLVLVLLQSLRSIHYSLCGCYNLSTVICYFSHWGQFYFNAIRIDSIATTISNHIKMRDRATHFHWTLAIAYTQSDHTHIYQGAGVQCISCGRKLLLYYHHAYHINVIRSS